MRLTYWARIRKQSAGASRQGDPVLCINLPKEQWKLASEKAVDLIGKEVRVEVTL